MSNKKKLKLIKKLCKNASPDEWGVPYVYASEIQYSRRETLK